MTEERKIICPEMYFNSFLTVRDRMSEFPQDVVKKEPMFFNSSLAFAYEHGGPITREFLARLDPVWHDEPAVLDSRVHMLMPGWYPAIPGWHHDDVPRPNQSKAAHFGAAGQPDYVTPAYHSLHMLALVGAPVSITEFAIGNLTLPAVYEGEITYGKWSPKVEEAIVQRRLSRWTPRMGDMVSFDAHSFHRSVPSIGSGWRWFCRVSRNTLRTDTITNELRTQVQVYIGDPEKGW